MDLFGDMDPYIMIHCNDAKYCTKVKRNAGCLPSWKYDEQKFEIKLKTHHEMIRLSAYDQDVIFDDFLGKSKEYKASVLADITSQADWVDLFDGDKKSGCVKIQCKLIPNK